MKCKARLDRFPDNLVIRAYGAVSDYGYSVMRPLGWLMGVVLAGWLIIGLWWRGCAQVGCGTLKTDNPMIEGMGISIGNTLPFLGLVRKMHPEFHGAAPPWLDLISGGNRWRGLCCCSSLASGYAIGSG